MAGREQRLLELLRRLPAGQVEYLLEFAQFLVDRHGEVPAAQEPQRIPRPETESVVKAIQRLVATYPMVDRAKVMNETSSLMAQHVMQGREAVAVIDELEIVFRRHYECIRAPEAPTTS